MPLQSNYTSFNHPMQATRRESLPRWRTQPSLKRVGPYIPSLATADHQKYESPKDRAMNQLMNQGADLHYTSYAPKRDEAARYGQDGYGSPDFPDTDDVTTMPTMESMDLTAVTTDHHHEIHDFSPSYEEWNNYDDELSTLTSQENHVAATSFATPSEHQFPKLPYAEIMNRALPPLPESVSEDNSASQPKTQLRRAATWLGKPIDQFLSSNQVYSLGRKMSQGLPQTQRGGSADHNDMIYYEETTRHDDNHYHAGMEVTPTVNAETMQGSRRVDRHPASAEERFYGTDTDHFGFVSPVTIVKRTYAPTKVLKKKTIHCQGSCVMKRYININIVVC
ncbi:uncharacterized protein BYT42DRAFT_560754 [Radiomyces spectabilis]|uniref:uncharacterized protein n=1 Tax=Radiomyces spectabilis TaxID=64574 RepID=UPI00221F827A|nr:uncharacterized protein BYT42DRAFT_560754 [Radiomyces spectabilis]KAI8388636.1 hypothetical protein BYT42DRAFT_560754 [Radiomyces spectabilis]